jgi:Family of unknown function (DUF6152)
MKTRVSALCVVAMSLLMVSMPAFAHHGAAAFDSSKAVTVKGTVTEFQFVNPHVLIFWTVKALDGSLQKWAGELTSPNHLVREGWTRHSLKVGDQITVTGYVAKDGAKSMWIRKVVLAGGQAIGSGSGD